MDDNPETSPVFSAIHLIYEHPVTKAVLTYLVLSTGFMAGVVYSIGLEYLAIINKVNLAIQIAFFASVFGFLVNVGLALLSTVFNYALMILFVKNKGVDEKPNGHFIQNTISKLTKIFRRLPGLIVLLIFFVFVVLFLWPWSQLFERQEHFFPSLSQAMRELSYSGLLRFEGTLIQITLLFFAFYKILSYHSSPSNTVDRLMTMYPIHLSLLRASLLIGTVVLGLAWADFIRYESPRIELTLSDSHTETGAILMNVSGGLVLFFDSDLSTHFIPYENIKDLRTAMAPTPSNEAKTP